MAIKSTGTLGLAADIQPEFGSNSLVGNASAAGLSLPVSMTQFYGLSSSILVFDYPNTEAIVSSVDAVDDGDMFNGLLVEATAGSGGLYDIWTLNGLGHYQGYTGFGSLRFNLTQPITAGTTIRLTYDVSTTVSPMDLRLEVGSARSTENGISAGSGRSLVATAPTDVSTITVSLAVPSNSGNNSTVTLRKIESI